MSPKVYVIMFLESWFLRYCSAVTGVTFTFAVPGSQLYDPHQFTLYEWSLRL